MNAIRLSIFANRIDAICGEMGVTLQKSAFSPNIRDWLDEQYFFHLMKNIRNKQESSSDFIAQITANRRGFWWFFAEISGNGAIDI